MSALPTPHLLTLDRDPHYPGLLATALSCPAARATGWRDLYASAAAAPAHTVVCVDPYFGAPEGIAPELRGLRLLLPRTRIVAAVDLSTTPAGDVLRLGHMGVVDVIGRAAVDMREAVGRIRALSQPAVIARIERAFEGRLDPGVRAIVRTAAELVGSGQPHASLAGRLYVSERTLLRACRRLGIPGPQRLMAWARVLHAVALLDEPGRRIRDVARAAGFASDRCLRRSIGRHLGCRAEEMRRAGSFVRAVRRFVDALRPPTLPRERRNAGAGVSPSVF